MLDSTQINNLKNGLIFKNNYACMISIWTRDLSFQSSARSLCCRLFSNGLRSDMIIHLLLNCLSWCTVYQIFIYSLFQFILLKYRSICLYDTQHTKHAGSAFFDKVFSFVGKNGGLIARVQHPARLIERDGKLFFYPYPVVIG